VKSNLACALITLTPLVFLSGCDAPPPESRLVQEQRSGNVMVSLFSDTGEVREDSNNFALEFRDAETNEPISVENLQIQASMPMPGMAPMFGDVSTNASTTPGRYEFTADLDMVGGWNLIVTFDADGRVQFNVNAY
jgi:hypothetical protein